MPNKPLTRRGHARADLRGTSIVPLLTPFTPGGSLDEAVARRHFDHVLAAGNHGVLVGGTTGEAASMSLPMRARHIALAADHSRGRALVFAGIGANSLSDSIALAAAAFAAGADAVVAHLPSYFALGPAEMESWMRQLAGAVAGPLYLYNIPQATRLSLPLDAVDRLSRHPRIAGIKDSEPDAARQTTLATQHRGRDDFAVFVGSVPLASVAIRAGADGYIPSAGNIAPAVTRALADHLLRDERALADAVHQRLGVISSLYQKDRTLGQSLAAMKACLSLLGFGTPHVLPPLQALEAAAIEALRPALRENGLLP